MYTDLKHQTAVVTGGSKGIGHAIAERFGQEGMNVIINYHSDPVGAANAVKAATTVWLNFKEPVGRNHWPSC